MSTSHIQLLLPRTGVVAPNAAIVLEGFVEGGCKLTVQIAGEEISLGGGQWGVDALTYDEHVRPLSYWILNNGPKGWPPDSKVLVLAERAGQVFASFEVPIGNERDIHPPKFSTMGPPTARVQEKPVEPIKTLHETGDPRMDYETTTYPDPIRTNVIAIDHGPIEDPQSPIIVVEINLPNAPKPYGAIREGVAGTITLRPDPSVAAATTIDSIMLRDAAENWVRVENPCAIVPPAPPPPTVVGRFHVVAGTLEQTDDGKYVGTSDSSTENGYSKGHYLLAEPSTGNLDITMVAEKIDSGEMAVEIAFRGGFFAVCRHASSWLLHETNVATTWQTAPRTVMSLPLALRVVQRGQIVRAYIDEMYCGSITLKKPVRSAPVGVFFQGASGKAGRIRFRDFEVKELAVDPLAERSVTFIVRPIESHESLDELTIPERQKLGSFTVQRFPLRSGHDLGTFALRALDADFAVSAYEREIDNGVPLDTSFIDQSTLPSVVSDIAEWVELIPFLATEKLCEHGGWVADPARVRTALETGAWPVNGDPAEESAAVLYWLLRHSRDAVKVNAGVVIEHRGELD